VRTVFQNCLRLAAVCAVSALAHGETAVSERNWGLQATVQVDETGIHLDQILEPGKGDTVPHLKVADAPQPGKSLTLNRDRILEAIRAQKDLDAPKILVGAEAVKVTRKMRKLEESEVRELVAAVLQKDLVGQRGDLELRWTRPWAPITVPDDPLKVRILDLPLSGLSANFVLRFEVSAGSTLLGAWSSGVQAQVWREIWVTRAPLARGQGIRDADLTLEKRDILTFKEEPASLDPNDSRYEFSRAIPAGSPIFARMLRVRPVIRRGQVVEALIQDGSLQIGAKVEVLEDGAPGQFVRVRNLQSRREFKGKVRDEETIVVAL
jgi:flagella basal body P-ring formation protein FlgA